MVDYGKMYFLLFNRITDALTEIEKRNYGHATDILKAAQVDAEAIYMSCEDEMPQDHTSS